MVDLEPLLKDGCRYRVEGGVAVFPVAGEHAQAQAAHFDEEADEEFEIERPRGTTPLYEWLIEEKFRRSVSGVGGLVPGATTLVVCGGSGMETELLARAGAAVVTADISLGAS